MIAKIKKPLFFIFIILIAAGFRLPHLSIRPLHTDEAVHGIKFGTLLEDGKTIYDPVEYHGPTLNVLTWIPAKILGQNTLLNVNETTLRIVPVVFGIFLIALTFWLVPGLGWPAVLAASLFMALSPALTFYSRYYIQEILLVCFSMGWIASVFRYSLSRKWGWIVLSGLFFGLMHATKETCIITWWAAGSALLILYLIKNEFTPSFQKPEKRSWIHLSLFFIVSAITSIWFFSSGFTHPHGILDSITTYPNYFFRAGQNLFHNHGWSYYFRRLFFFASGGKFWSEWPVALLAIVGWIHTFRNWKAPNKQNSLVQFIAIYGILLTGVYVVIPYKTPWSMLSFYHAWILLAGIGFAVFIKWTENSRTHRIAFILLCFIGTGHLGYQAWVANFRDHSSPDNPYVYSHPTEDVFKIVDHVISASDEIGQTPDWPMHVIISNHEYWPLPWYLRDMNFIGWYGAIPENWTPAPILLFSPEFEDRIIQKLYTEAEPGQRHLYVPLFDENLELRPGQIIRGYIRYDYLNKSSSRIESGDEDIH
ncbi:TIGR03663 family protein [candidate division KSB1 bacterium]|nr:TIGR03663 family protein [candidate division KSB1 bacterium]